MIAAVILILLSVATVVAAIEGSIAITCSLIVVAVGYAAILYRELLRVSRSIDSASAESPENINKDPGSAWVSSSENIANGLEALRYRLHSLQSRLDSEVVRRSFEKDNGVGQASLDSLTKSGGANGDGILFRDMLKFVSERFRGSAYAIVVREQVELDPFKVYAHGIQGARFDRRIIEYFVPHFERQSRSCFGLHDTSDNESVVGDFGVFGFRYFIAAPLSWREPTGKRQAVLWIGYASESPPRAQEADLVQEAAQTIEHQLENSRHIYELSGQVEQAKHRDLQKNEFIAHMSHDIRSPLNNIKSILNLFRMEGFTTDTSEMIDVALNNCESMAEIVEDVLDYSRHSAGQLSASTEVVDLARTTETVVQGFRVTARLKGLDLLYEGSTEAISVLADQRQVKRIISNVVSNAIKYTQRGRVELKIERIDADRSMLRIRDTGIGLSQEQVSRLFTPFTRFHGTDVEGIGLGLTLTKILVELNNGTINVTSTPGAGSEFTIYFRSAQQEVIIERGPIKLRTEFQPTVLLVDDDFDFVETLARSLEHAGCKVLKALTVEDALSICNFESPDVVVSDSSMPDGGGEQLVRKLSLRHGLPVIIVSGKDSQNVREQWQKLGVSDVLAKPVELNDLMDAIRKACAKPSQGPALSSSSTG